MRIAEADPRDPATAQALVALQHAGYAVEAQLIGTDAIPALRETPAQLAQTQETFLATEDGFVSYRREADTVDIHRLVVHPRAHRRGLATALLDALDAREPDAARTIVATGAGNAPALALYERRGFVRTGERTVPPGVAIVLLERRNPSA